MFDIVEYMIMEWTVPNEKTLQGRLIVHKFNTGWTVGGCDEECGKEEEWLASLQSSIGQKRIAGLKN